MTADAQITHRRDRISNALCCALIVLTVFVTFGRLFRADFTNWDDAHTILDNPDFNPPTARTLLGLWTSPRAHLYVPMTYSAWWMLAKFSYATSNGQIVHNPHVFHIANIAFHAAAACLVFAILRRTNVPRSCAAIGGLIFALHPVQVEAVAWVSGTKDVLCGLLVAIALWQYIVYAQSHSTRPYVICCIAFVAAMLSKPTAVMFPLMALAVDLFLLRRSIADIVRGIVPLALFAIPGIVAAAQLQDASRVTTLTTVPKRPLIALDAITFYMAKIGWPFDLALDYGRDPRAVLASGAWHYTAVVPIIIAAIIFVVRRRLPELAAGAMIFVAMLLPLLGLVPFDFQQYSTVADHYLYMPMIGIALIVACLLARARHRAVVIALSAIVCTALAVRAFDQSRHWSNTETLWRHTIAVNPNSWVSCMNLGEYYVTKDPPDLASAKELLERSISLYEANEAAHLNLGAVYLQRNQLPEATREFERAVAIQPTSEAHTNLANAYGQAGRIQDAILQYQQALKLDPKNEKAARMLVRAQGYLRHLQTRPTTTQSATRPID